jgi:hypothetical protein
MTCEALESDICTAMGPNCCLKTCVTEIVGFSSCIVEASTGQFLECDSPNCPNSNIANIAEGETELPLLSLDTSADPNMPSSDAFQWGEIDVLEIEVVCATEWDSFFLCLLFECRNFLEVCDGTVGPNRTWSCRTWSLAHVMK